MAKTHTVLCVDDEKNILNSLKRLLRKEPYRLLTSSDPDEVFELLRNNDVQLIISDQRMPEISGTELLEKVKKEYPDILRIVLSGYTDVDSITESINKGNVYRFFLKPWNDKNLKNEIRQALEQYDLLAAVTDLHSEVVKKNTALKELNRALELSHAILEDIPMPIISVNSQAMIVFFNRNTVNLPIGCEKIVLGKNISSFFNDDICSTVSICLKDQIKKQVSRFQIEDKVYDIEMIPLTGKFAGEGAIMIFYRA